MPRLPALCTLLYNAPAPPPDSTGAEHTSETHKQNIQILTIVRAQQYPANPGSQAGQV